MGARVTRVTGETGVTRVTGETGVTRVTRETGETGIPALPILPVFLVFPLGRPAPAVGRRSSVDKKTHRAEGFLCQKKERVRSLLGVGEELAYRSATPKTLFICFCL